MWDEENRIRSIYDNGSQHHYIYDAAGERVLKGKSTGQRIFVNGELKAGSGQMGNYTVYVNPYLVLKSGGYTKHYYIESQRIVSKLGGGWDNKNSVKAGGNKVDYVGQRQKVFDGIVKNLKFLGADGQILTAGKSGKIPPGQISGSGNVAEPFRYFYHPDHLGSTSYVTDASGEVYQHLEYFAFGETFVEEHSNTDRTPYLFNGRELDEETALYYYGARYYDARTSIFLSVDGHGERYPGWSPYSYTFNNPLRYIDPTGLDPEDAASKEGILLEEVSVTAERLPDKKINTDPLTKLSINTKANSIIGPPSTSQTDSESQNTFKTGTPPQDGRPELKGPGNFYRNKMATEAGKDMFERYWLAKGDMVLTKAQFDEIVQLAEAQGAAKIKGTATTLNGLAATAKVISFYGTPHANSLGSATLYYDTHGNAIGFYDYFNFDPKPWGVRSFSAEVKTRLVNGDGKIFGAKPFKITYP